MSTSREDKTNGHICELSSRQSNFTKQGSNVGENSMKAIIEAKKQQLSNKNSKE